jgi:5-methylcytosine-specific restriction endonuclease McrA
MGKKLESFDADRDRGNEQKAAELFNVLWPDLNVRMACAERLARSIRCAHKQANASWEITLFNWGVRLNVGQVLVLQFDSDDLLAYARSSRGKSVYNAVRVPSRTFQYALSKISAIPTKDWRDHELFIKAAAEAKKISPFKSSFSEGVVRHIETLLRAKLPRPAYFEPSTKILRPKVGRSDAPPELLDMPRVGTEGHRRLVSHLYIERDRGLVERKKREVLGAEGRLACEVCRFDFSVYKKLGEEFCEVHHLHPLSKTNAEVHTSLSDLAVVCANCHRMVHRGGQSRSLTKVRASLNRAARNSSML